MSLIVEVEIVVALGDHRASDVTHVTDITVLIRAALMRLE
jgi:hypothetical protein